MQQDISLNLEKSMDHNKIKQIICEYINTTQEDLVQNNKKIVEYEENIKSKIDRINTLTNELQSIKKEYYNLMNKYKKLKNVQSTKNGKAIFCMSFSDTLKYSRDISMQYLSKLNWEIINFDTILIMMEDCLNDEDIYCLDEIIVNVTDYQLKKLSNFNFDKLLNIIGVFIDLQIETQVYSLSGITYLLREVYILNWTELLRNFIIEKYKKINSLCKILPNKYVFDIEIINKIYFMLNNKEAFHDLMDTEVIKDKDIEMELDGWLDLLFISLYYQKDAKLIDDLDHVKKLLRRNIPEIICYQYYYKGIEKIENTQHAVDKIHGLIDNCNNIDSKIKDKAFKKMIMDLNELIKINEKKQLEEQKKQQKAKMDSLEKVKEVIRIKVTRKQCPFDHEELKIKNCLVEYYIDKRSMKNEEKARYKNVTLPYCPKCGKNYINNDIAKYINGYLIEYDLTKNSRSVDNNKSIILKSEYHNNDDYGAKLNDESELRTLGYTTQLNKQQRWDILINKAIPKLGYAKVISYINYFIERSVKIQKKDFSRAISEWEYDLKRLKNI